MLLWKHSLHPGQGICFCPDCLICSPVVDITSALEISPDLLRMPFWPIVEYCVLCCYCLAAAIFRGLPWTVLTQRKREKEREIETSWKRKNVCKSILVLGQPIVTYKTDIKDKLPCCEAKQTLICNFILQSSLSLASNRVELYPKSHACMTSSSSLSFSSPFLVDYLGSTS